MMLKKITAIFFLMLASITMLAFAVVPHHHHEEYICFNSEHCTHELPGQEHSHDTDPVQTDHGCVRNLFQTQIIRSQSLEHTCSDGHCHHFTFLIFLVPDVLSLLQSESDINVKSDIFYQERLHSIRYFSQLSGRAPPIC